MTVEHKDRVIADRHPLAEQLAKFNLLFADWDDPGDRRIIAVATIPGKLEDMKRIYSSLARAIVRDKPYLTLAEYDECFDVLARVGRYIERADTYRRKELAK